MPAYGRARSIQTLVETRQEKPNHAIMQHGASMPKQSAVLIVEDEVAMRTALAETFHQHRFRVLTAEDGRSGLATALEQHPDIILLDILLPMMDGMQVLTELKRDAWGKQVPVILLTNVNDPAKVAQGIAAGAYDYLVKQDWNLEDVVRKVKERLSRTAQTAADR